MMFKKSRKKNENLIDGLDDKSDLQSKFSARKSNYEKILVIKALINNFALFSLLLFGSIIHI